MIWSCSFCFLFWLIQRMLCVCVFSQVLILPFKFFCQLFDYEMVVIIRNIMKHHTKFFWCFVSYITDTMDNVSILSCKRAVITKFTIVFISLHLWQNLLLVWFFPLPLLTAAFPIFSLSIIYVVCLGFRESSPLEIMLAFVVGKWTVCEKWITTCNMLVYFWIAITCGYFFEQRFHVCIDNKWILYYRFTFLINWALLHENNHDSYTFSHVI